MFLKITIKSPNPHKMNSFLEFLHIISFQLFKNCQKSPKEKVTELK